jgi:hypothetical protein
MRPTRRDRILRFASGFALLGLGLMTWSVLDPRWVPVMLGLSLGQAIGTTSFALYLLVVAADLGIRRRLHKEKLASEARSSAP